jgi:peptide/nickel transport system ATP-binding protein
VLDRQRGRDLNSIEVRAVRVRYGDGADALTAVDGVDLAVPKGGTLGLVGESGSGKSTIARALVGLVPVVGGTITLDGKDCTSQRSRDSAAYRRRVQMVFQDPYSSLNPRMTVGQMMGEALALRGLAARNFAERRKEGLRIMELLGLSASAFRRYPHQFSGGQRQRIAIARALAVGPEVVIADEVTSALDVSVQATILNLLKNLQKVLGLSLLFISHDLSVVRLMCDRIAVMYLGRVVEQATSEDLFSAPRHPYTKALMRSIPTFVAERRPAPLTGDVPDPRNPPPGCRFHTRCPIGPIADPARTICVERDPQYLIRLSNRQAACHFADVDVGSDGSAAATP